VTILYVLYCWNNMGGDGIDWEVMGKSRGAR
jgi:hypothetical protein